MAAKALRELTLAAPAVPDERRLCPNQGLSRDPHHMGDLGCYQTRPVALPPRMITPPRPFTPERWSDLAFAFVGKVRHSPVDARGCARRTRRYVAVGGLLLPGEVLELIPHSLKGFHHLGV